MRTGPVTERLEPPPTATRRNDTPKASPISRVGEDEPPAGDTDLRHPQAVVSKGEGLDLRQVHGDAKQTERERLK